VVRQRTLGAVITSVNPSISAGGHAVGYGEDLFFAIVWSIAGAFVAELSIGAIVPIVWTISLSIRLCLSSTSPQPAVDSCKEVLEQWGRTHSTRELDPVRKYSREFAWAMGFEVGRVVGPLAMARSTVADTQQYLERATDPDQTVGLSSFVDAIIVFVADREPDETDHEAKRSAIRALEGVTYRADRQWLTSTDVGNTRISATGIRRSRCRRRCGYSSHREMARKSARRERLPRLEYRVSGT
jgi:hypothetical protein